MFAEIFQHQENEVKECGLKTVNEVRGSNFLAGGPRFLATLLLWRMLVMRLIKVSMLLLA